MKLLKTNLKYKFGIRTKILFSVLIIIVLSNSFLLYFAVVKFGEKLENNNISYSNETIGNLVSNINDYFDEVISITNLAVYNHSIQSFLNNNSASNTESISNLSSITQIFGNAMNMRSDVISVIIINNTGAKIVNYIYAPNNDISSDYKNQPWYKRAVEAKGAAVVTGPYVRSYTVPHHEPQKNLVPVFSVSRIIDNSLGVSPLGVILIDANLNKISTLCNSVRLNSNGLICIIDNYGNLIYSTSGAKNHNFKSLLNNFSSTEFGSFNTFIDNKKNQVVFKKMEKTGWIVFTVTPYDNLIADASNIKNLIIIVNMICLILVLSITSIFLTKLTKPITVLKKHMDIADHGNLGIRVNIRTHDEIGLLASSFNHMLERIETLMKQVVSEQEEKRKSDLKSLQAQINPHFLYNTLDSIVWMAENRDSNIVAMTEALANLFRISLSKGQELITLSEELEHVRNYLIIQSMRYANKFDYEIYANEYALKCKTLKIILQPLVENSIYHGIKNKATKGHIKIKAYPDNERLVIEVSDDGIGMAPEMCNLILVDPSVQINSSGSGIGVRNVSERIRLYFGNKYGINFQSQPGIGTTAYIYLPIIRD